MEYSLRAMELWFQHLPGSLLLAQESDALKNYFSRRKGMHCLQVGGPSDFRLIQSAHFPYKTYLSTQFSSTLQASRIQSDLDALPILPNSLDAVVLVHMLEFAKSPQQLLKETYRILAPGGQLVLLAFNPCSLWGIARLKRRKQGFPWSGRFYPNARIKHWLQGEGYSIVLSKTLCFRPVLQEVHQCQRWSFLESIGSRCFPGFGAALLMIAQKREVGMTPIKVHWNRRKVKVGGRAVEPTTYR